MSDPADIPGFDHRGNLYRAPVSLERADALDVHRESVERGVPVTAVLRDRIRSTVKRRRGSK